MTLEHWIECRQRRAMCTTRRTWGANLQGGAIAHRCGDRNDRGLHQSSNYRWKRSICARNHHYHIGRPHSCSTNKDIVNISPMLLPS